jgi:hypothetical protein
MPRTHPPRVMKLADGGFGPAYNLQFATDTESRLIMGVGATNAGSDSHQLEPMPDELQRRTAAVPKQHLADGGDMNFASVERSAERGSRCFRRRARTATSISIRSRPSPALAAYRLRLASAEGKEIYKARRSIKSAPPPPRPSTPTSRPGAAWTACCSARC